MVIRLRQALLSQLRWLSSCYEHIDKKSNRKEVNRLLQRLEIIGYLGRDPELRYTPTGTAVAHFTVATNRRWTTADGETAEQTTWFRITTWTGLAETCARYLATGRQVYIDGRLQPDPDTGGPRLWTGDDGVARAQFEVTANRVIFLGKGTGERPLDSLPDAPAEDDQEDDPIPF